MSNVDERIVNMRIDNRQFLGGVKSTLSALTNLTGHLRKIDGNNGLDNMAKGADGVKQKFSMLNAAALTVVATITNKMVNAGLNMVKSLTLAPIMDGFHEYQTNLNSIQTVMANTGKGVDTVNKYMNDLNHYSDKTIYNFSEMAKNIGTFTAAGVDLKTSTQSIKGIANLAALSGSSSQQASGAMYQLSQAIAAGRVGLQDWNSVVNAGMGGKTFQKALANTAAAMGAIDKQQIAGTKSGKTLTIAGESFRESIQSKPGHNSWLTSKVLTNTLQQFTGDLSKAQLKAMGFNKEEQKAIQSMAKTAQQAATRIKTFPQMMDVIKESVGSGWAKIFQDIFGNFTQSAKLWTSIGNGIVNSISGAFKRVDKLLMGWSAMGGRQDIIAGFKNLAQPIIAVFKAIGEGWRMVFPPATAKSLKDMTQGFQDFTAKLHIGGKTAGQIRDVFAGVFSVLHAGASIVGLIFHAIFGFFGLFSGGASGGILSIAAALGQLLQRFDDFVSGRVVDTANTKLDGFFGSVSKLGPGLSKIASAVGSGLKRIGGYIHDLFGSLDGFDWATIFGGAAAGGSFVVIKKFLDTLDNLFSNAGGMIANIKSVFGALGDTLEAYQQNLKANALLKIAGAVGILAASLLVLSTIPAENMAKGLGAIGALMVQLVGSMAVLAKVNKSIKLVAMATAMDLMAAAILALSVAVGAFGLMSPKVLGQGLAAIAGSMLMLVGVSALMGKFGKSFIFAATSMTLLATALNLMAGAVLLFGSMSLETMGKGLLGVAGAMVVIAGAMRLMPGGVKMILAGAGLNAVAVAVTILAGALKILGSMSMEQLGKGLVAMAIGLGEVALALNLMAGTLSGAAALLIAAGAITALTASLVILGNMSIESLAKSLIALAAGLAILIAAGALAEAVAPGLLALGAAVLMLGAGVGLAAAGVGVLALGLAALGAAGTAAISVIIHAIESFLKLLPNIAVAAATSFVAFIGAIAQAAPKIANSFVKIISSLLDSANRLLPKVFTVFNNFLGKLIDTITRNAPKFGHMFQVLINTGLKVLQNSIPKMVTTGMAILQGILTGISNRLPRLMSTATDIVVKFINGISNHLDRVVNAGTNLVIRFIVGIGNAASRIVDAAGKTILKFLNAVDSSVKKYSGQIGAAGRQIAFDLVDGLTGGLLSTGMSRVRSAVSALANAIPGPLKKIMGIASPSKVMHGFGQFIGIGLSNGIEATHKVVSKSAVGLALATINSTMEALDIHSPSGVFKSLGINVAQGFVNGIVASLNIVRAAGVTMAKDTYDMVTRTTTDLQLKANAQQAKADALKFAAALTRQKLHNKKLTKAQKASINAQAKHLENRSTAYANASAASLRGVEAANKAEDDARAFNEADAAGRADILNQRAQDAAASAAAARQNAIKLQNEADLIRKKDAKRAKALAKQARDALASAQRYATAAQSNAVAAQQYAVQVVLNSSGSVSSDLNSWLAQDAADKAYAAMTAEQQQTEMARRAAEDQKKSDDLIASARQKLAQANALASTNAKAAQDLVDSAAADVEAAKAAKEQADQEKSDAQSLAEQIAGGTTSAPSTAGGASGANAADVAAALKMPEMTISSAGVFDAQNMFDAYTKALAATTAAAQGDQARGITFVQNNTSPVALSPSEVYRQSKNLLSNAERKLAGALS